MIYVLGQIWIWLLLALVLGALLSWLWSRLSASSRTEEQLGPWRDRVSSLEHERDALRRDLGEARDRATESEARLSALRDDLAEYESRIEALLRELDEFKTEKPNSETSGSETSGSKKPSDEPGEDEHGGETHRGNGTGITIDEPTVDSADVGVDQPDVTEAQGSLTPDPLSKIKGIGAAMEKRLNALGISTFAQLADLTESEIARIDEAIGFKGRIKRENWIGQARGFLSEH